MSAQQTADEATGLTSGLAPLMQQAFIAEIRAEAESFKVAGMADRYHKTGKLLLAAAESLECADRLLIEATDRLSIAAFMAATIRDCERHFALTRSSEGRALWKLVKRALDLYDSALARDPAGMSG